MAIRSAAKAIVLHNNQILVNQCITEGTGEIYYDLPGGGQHQFETMEEAVIREVMEETGYKINIVKFAAIAEVISDDEERREKYNDYAHKIFHIFLAALVSDIPEEPSEKDFQQVKCEWVSLEDADRIPFKPDLLVGKFADIIGNPSPQFLGSVHE